MDTYNVRKIDAPDNIDKAVVSYPNKAIYRLESGILVGCVENQSHKWYGNIIEKNDRYLIPVDYKRAVVVNKIDDKIKEV